ncbi:MAG: glucarate dehydratase [Chloroflexota bacterium]|nr:glucarate dehydratase [Chloroflexota bacterium]
MRIVQMNVTPVAIADPPLLNSNGVHQPYALRTIVELVSEDGISGWGEVAGGAAMLAAFERARANVVGSDAFALTRLQVALADAAQPSPTDEVLMQRMNPLRAMLRVFSGLEVAALDLIGKALGIPVCNLLGGKVRAHVPFSAYLFYKLAGGGGDGSDARADVWGEATTPEGIVAQAQAMIARYGFGSVKLKAGVYPPEQEIAAMRALRATLGPSVPLRIDPNAAWTVDTSVAVAVALADTLEYLEDPAPGMEGMAAVHARLVDEGLIMPLATNMVVTSFDDVRPSLDPPAVDIILGDHHYWGGLRATTHLGTLCSALGLGLSMHSNSHLGISLLAMTHVAAATPHLTYACDTHYPWQDGVDEVLVGGKIPIINGAVTVPSKPGLGVQIDRDALARGRERYASCGFTERDDAGEMRRRVDPEWRHIQPRW